MILLATSLMALFTTVAADVAPIIVPAPDSPVHLRPREDPERRCGGTRGAAVRGDESHRCRLEQFTVIAFIFDAEGVLKTRQLAPGRRTLEKKGTKYSTMVLDGRVVTATDRVVSASTRPSEPTPTSGGRRTSKRRRRKRSRNSAGERLRGLSTSRLMTSALVTPASLSAGMNLVNSVSNGRNWPPPGSPTRYQPASCETSTRPSSPCAFICVTSSTCLATLLSEIPSNSTHAPAFAARV